MTHCVGVLVSISVPASVSVSEGVTGGAVQVCARISGGSDDVKTTTAISARLATSESSPGENIVMRIQ